MRERPKDLVIKWGVMCCCAVHCPENTYHEKACCDAVWCDCWCHVKDAEESSQYLDDFQAFDGTLKTLFGDDYV